MSNLIECSCAPSGGHDDDHDHAGQSGSNQAEQQVMLFILSTAARQCIEPHAAEITCRTNNLVVVVVGASRTQSYSPDLSTWLSPVPSARVTKPSNLSHWRKVSMMSASLAPGAGHSRSPSMTCILPPAALVGKHPGEFE